MNARRSEEGVDGLFLRLFGPFLSRVAAHIRPAAKYPPAGPAECTLAASKTENEKNTIGTTSQITRNTGKGSPELRFSARFLEAFLPPGANTLDQEQGHKNRPRHQPQQRRWQVIPEWLGMVINILTKARQIVFEE